MPARARRLPARMLQRFVRRALLTCCLWHAGKAFAEGEFITSATYAEPTGAYPHGVLGDDQEWSNLVITVSGAAESEGGRSVAPQTRKYTLTASHRSVFEDVTPRVWDITGDGNPELVAIESHFDRGARMVVFGLVGGQPEMIAATPHIGRRFRWLAPIGAADLDGDGHVEIAFVDRPHLARILRVWRYAKGDFTEVATVEGFSNHRIGEPFISGGIRECGNGAEIITANGPWTAILATRLGANGLDVREVGPLREPRDLARALDCKPV